MFGAIPLIGRRPADINDENPEYTPGQYFMWRDPANLEFGLYRYLQNVSGSAFARGDLTGKAATITGGVVDGTCTLRKIYDAAKFTAAAHKFDFVNIYDAVSNTIPEGDFLMLGNNTVNEIFLDDSAADFSALPVTGDKFEVERPFKAIDGSGAQDWDTYQGWAAAAITNAYWGMFLVKGRRIDWLSGTGTAGTALIGNGTSVAAFAGGNQETIIGVCSTLTAYVNITSCVCDVDLVSGGIELGA